MLGINLHATVRGSITGLHPDESVMLFQSLGNVNVFGKTKPQFAPGAAVAAQIQSEGADTLEQSRDVNFTAQVRKCYLFSETAAGETPQGIVRWVGRGGDVLQRGDESWWKVVAMLEDFTNSGWVCVRIQALVEAPEMIILEPTPDPEPEPEPGDPNEPDPNPLP